VRFTQNQLTLNPIGVLKVLTD